MTLNCCRDGGVDASPLVNCPKNDWEGNMRGGISRLPLSFKHLYAIETSRTCSHFLTYALNLLATFVSYSVVVQLKSKAARVRYREMSGVLL